MEIGNPVREYIVEEPSLVPEKIETEEPELKPEPKREKKSVPAEREKVGV